MLELRRVSAATQSGRIKDINAQFEKLGVNALLCPNATFLDELLSTFLGEQPLTDGQILLDGEDYFRLVRGGEVQLIIGQDTLFPNLTAQDNVLFSEEPFFYFHFRKRAVEYERVLAETGLYLPARQKASKMSREDRKILELLRSYYRRPKLLLLRDLTSCLSYKNFAIVLGLLDLMCSRGTEILYLSSQWEEAVKIADQITIFSHGRNYGCFPAEQVAENPRYFFPIMVGSHPYQVDKDENKKIEVLRLINENMPSFTDTVDLRKSLHMFSKYVMNIAKAGNCLIYLVDQNQQNLLQVVAKDDEASRSMFIPQDSILHLSDSPRMLYLNCNESMFATLFPAEADFRTVVFMPNALSNRCKLLIEVVYPDYYVYTEEELLLLKWAAKEIGILVEKTKLMGSSVLLQESHHRIKNNLQIIVSLLEMERSQLEEHGILPQDTPVISQILNDISQRVQSMASIHNLLCRKNTAGSMIDLYSIVREVAGIYEDAAAIQLDFEEMLIPYGMAVSFALVANEIINNSVKHNRTLSRPLSIRISAKLNPPGDLYQIVFQDNGHGFDERAEKSEDGGIGTVIIDSIVHMELCGEYRKRNQNGARVELDIPASFILEEIKK